MAFDRAGVTLLMTGGNGESFWKYTTTDARSAVQANGYFDGAVDLFKYNDPILVEASDSSFITNVTNWNLVTDEVDTETTPPLITSPDASSLGWGDYEDGTYTVGSPFAIAAATDTIIDNNADGSNSLQEVPSDLPNGLFNATTNKVLGRAGDSFMFTFEANVDRQSGNGTYTMDMWFDIGGGIPDLYKRTISLKGSGEQHVTWTTGIYTLDTWESNGADLYVNSEVAVDMYDIRYIIHRLHKGIGDYS